MGLDDSAITLDEVLTICHRIRGFYFGKQGNRALEVGQLHLTAVFLNGGSLQELK